MTKKKRIIFGEFFWQRNAQKKRNKRESEYAASVKIAFDNEEKLGVWLSGGGKHLFSQPMNAQCEIIAVETRERFIAGWKLGVKFMLDTFVTLRYNPINGVCEAQSDTFFVSG